MSKYLGHAFLIFLGLLFALSYEATILWGDLLTEIHRLFVTWF